MDLGYYVLYLHHGFGNKRIVRLERTINEYLERAQTENEMKTETLAELLKVRYSIDVQKEINLIPMQQLIRIYQRNNPLTINDTRQLLNDTAYSYMTLACTALKLMFKLSVKEIKEFIAEFRDLIDTLYKFNQFGLTLPKVAQCLADEVNYVDERYISDKPTNAGRIRNMSDEELAEFLTTVTSDAICGSSWDYDGWIKELQSEAE
jgi:hypothetical protein